MACGLPVVASPVGMNKQVVSHGENGFLASTDAEWITHLTTLLQDPAPHPHGPPGPQTRRTGIQPGKKLGEDAGLADGAGVRGIKNCTKYQVPSKKPPPSLFQSSAVNALGVK